MNLREILHRPGAIVTLALAVAINSLLASAYLWSYGGQSTHLRIEVEGRQFTALIDGHEHIKVLADAPSGGPTISIAAQDGIETAPSIPRPRGVTRITVTSLPRGELLYEWRPGQPPPTSSPDTIDLSGRNWQDYTVDVYYQNPVSADIRMRGRSEQPFLFGFGRNSFYFSYREPGGALQEGRNPHLELSRAEDMRGLLAVGLRSYPLALLLIAVTAGLVLLSALVSRHLVESSWSVRVPQWLVLTAAGVIVLFALVATAVIESHYVQRMPHIVDETSYIFQARVLAQGRTHVAPPAIPAAFQFWFEPFIIDYDGRWASFYPFGHPLVLAIGIRAGVLWLVPPFVGAACVALLFVLGKRTYGPQVGLLAALLLATSPFFLMQASSFMSHNTAALFLLGCLVGLTFRDRRAAAWGTFSGLAFGLFFNTRPFTAVVLAPFVILLVLWPLLRVETRRAGIWRCAGFVGGACMMLAAYYAYNYATFGGPGNGYEASGDLGQVIGFGGDHHSVARGIQNQKLQLESLVLVLHGWSIYAGFMFILLPFMLGSRKLFDWWLLIASLSVMAAWIIYNSHGIAYGPRYWYEIAPLLLLLAARGAVCTAEACTAGVGRLFGAGHRRYLPALPAQVFVTCLILALIGSSVYGWLLAKNPSWGLFGTPARPAEMRLLTDDRLIRAIDEVNPQNALVLVRPCSLATLCYQTVFWLNDPDLDGAIVYANDLGPRNPELFALYPCRDVYVAAYEPPSLRRTGATPCDE